MARPITKTQVSFLHSVLWIVSLAFLSVGARNFEDGITLDGPFYATIARNIVASGNWFTLNPGVPDLNPFYGNPHLGFWVFAAWLKIFPARDWALRIVNHLYYVSFLLLFFHFVRRKSGEIVAAITLILLWIWFQFSNPHSNIYLDPGALFWGTLAVILFESNKGIFAGMSLALCALYKSMTFVGFLPALLLIAFRKRSVRELLAMLVVSIAGFGLYALLLRASPEPEFLQQYWAMQITNRFARVWDLSLIFSWEYWKQFFYYSYYLAPLCLFSIGQKAHDRVLPITVATSFTLLFSLSNLVGGQYLIMIFPWLAWLIAQGISRWVPWTSHKIMRATRFIALVGVCLIQYLPIRTHAREIPPELIEIGRLSDAGVISHLYLDTPPSPSPFVISAPFAWYGRVKVFYPPKESVPARDRFAYFLNYSDDERELLLQQNGWCRYGGHVSYGSLWLACKKA